MDGVCYDSLDNVLANYGVCSQQPLSQHSHSQHRKHPLGFWTSFNSWWRAAYISSNKRPGSESIMQWYNARADAVWGDNKPSYQELQRHANCMKALDVSKASASMDDGMADEDDEHSLSSYPMSRASSLERVPSVSGAFSGLPFLHSTSTKDCPSLPASVSSPTPTDGSSDSGHSRPASAAGQSLLPQLQQHHANAQQLGRLQSHLLQQQQQLQRGQAQGNLSQAQMRHMQQLRAELETRQNHLQQQISQHHRQEQQLMQRHGGAMPLANGQYSYDNLLPAPLGSSLQRSPSRAATTESEQMLLNRKRTLQTMLLQRQMFGECEPNLMHTELAGSSPQASMLQRQLSSCVPGSTSRLPASAQAAVQAKAQLLQGKRPRLSPELMPHGDVDPARDALLQQRLRAQTLQGRSHSAHPDLYHAAQDSAEAELGPQGLSRLPLRAPSAGNLKALGNWRTRTLSGPSDDASITQLPGEKQYNKVVLAVFLAFAKDSVDPGALLLRRGFDLRKDLAEAVPPVEAVFGRFDVDVSA